MHCKMYKIRILGRFLDYMQLNVSKLVSFSCCYSSMLFGLVGNQFLVNFKQCCGFARSRMGSLNP